MGRGAALRVCVALLANFALASSAALAAQATSGAQLTRVPGAARPARLAHQTQQGGGAGRSPAIVTQVPLDTSQAVNFRVLAVPDTVYVGEQVTYQLGVFLERSVRDRLRRMEAIAPEMRGMMAYEPPAPLSGFPVRSVGALRYTAHVYERAIFPLAAGRLVIPPARLVYAMPLSYSFFSREESYELRSDSVIVIALEPPARGRPADWDGAVGTLSVEAQVDTTGARVGDAVRLTLSVSGRGNVKLFRRPRLDVKGASVVPTGERVTLTGDSLDVHGVKQFDWLLTPLQAGRLVLPSVRYPYFDPTVGDYRVASSHAVALSIAPGALASTGSGGAERSAWPVRSVYRGALAPAPYESRPFWWVMLLIPIPAAVLAIARQPRRRKRNRVPPPDRVLQLLSRAPSAEPRAVRRAFLTALGTRLHANAGLLADPSDLARAARRAGTAP
ncbi:MAG TPA: BatD family protein, partial [Gemmatimonadaceae bacterium]